MVARRHHPAVARCRRWWLLAAHQLASLSLSLLGVLAPPHLSPFRLVGEFFFKDLQEACCGGCVAAEVDRGKMPQVRLALSEALPSCLDIDDLATFLDQVNISHCSSLACLLSNA